MFSESEAAGAELLKTLLIAYTDSRPIVTLEDHKGPRKTNAGRLPFATKNVVKYSLQEICRS
jgi:hypothetical protein